MTTTDNVETYAKNWFWEWISEDDSLGGSYWYLYWEWINVTWHSKYLELYNKPILRNTTTNPYQILEAIDNETQQTYLFAFCASSNVYKLWRVNPVYTNTDIDFWRFPIFILDWYNWSTVEKYIYFVSSWNPWKLNRLRLVYSFSWNWSSVELWYKDLPSTATNWTWVVTRQNKAIMWFWSEITVLASTNTGDSLRTFSLTWWDNISWITYLSWYYRIYTTTWKLLLWDWNSEDIAEAMQINIKTEQVYQMANIDYVVAWYIEWRKALYAMSWYSPTLIFKSQKSELLNIIKSNIYKWYSALSNDLQKLFFIIYQSETDTYQIWSYWKDIQWLNNWYSIIVWKNSYWNFIKWLEVILISWWYLYYWFSDTSWNTWIDRVPLYASWLKSNWFLISNVNDNQNWILTKIFNNLYVRVKDITSTQYIEVYLSKDWWSFNLIKTINEQPLDWISRINVIWDYKEYSLKFILYSNNSTSPKIYYPYLQKYVTKQV